jgi:hypothetical protein
MGYLFDMEDYHNEIMEKKDLPFDLDGIKQAIESNQEEIRTAVMNGQAERMIELDNRMRILLARQFGVVVSETKKLIDKAELEKVSIGKQLELLREIKKQKNLQAGKVEQLFFKRMEKVADAQLQIEMANSRLTSARVTIRESKAKLQRLLEAKQKEQANAYQNYELLKY